ncbi:hypothetical protein DM02DRAFT_702041 [Periconia macrospinosa]|uniref:Uncharacterized protein n=1 Tax=Periconia macrospinosa TaxID=97972 RepID=A0A2V1D1U0_9PLEO|nr:hypothetical protein DM02DRAFT_702041 [Periconia macrospinosa]
MKYLQVLLGLAATVSAIDIKLHSSNNCGGGLYAYCTNWGPDSCCGQNIAAYLSVGFYAIPTNWNVETRAHTGGFCAGTRYVLGPQHRSTVCISEPDGIARFTGAGYGFTSRKAVSTEASATDCRPDGLVLDDGTNYALAALNEDQFSVLVCI